MFHSHCPGVSPTGRPCPALLLVATNGACFPFASASCCPRGQLPLFPQAVVGLDSPSHWTYAAAHRVPPVGRVMFISLLSLPCPPCNNSPLNLNVRSPPVLLGGAYSVPALVWDVTISTKHVLRWINLLVIAHSSGPRTCAWRFTPPAPQIVICSHNTSIVRLPLEVYYWELGNPHVGPLLLL